MSLNKTYATDGTAWEDYMAGGLPYSISWASAAAITGENWGPYGEALARALVERAESAGIRDQIPHALLPWRLLTFLDTRDSVSDSPAYNFGRYGKATAIREAKAVFDTVGQVVDSTTFTRSEYDYGANANAHRYGTNPNRNTASAIHEKIS